MEKSLYSLILMDDVVTQIDKIAMRRGTNRSNLVNQILAEYVSMMTPEKRVDNIFRCIESLLSENGELVPFVAPNQMTMSVKSSLEYKYRPTIKYEVHLFRTTVDDAIGELTVAFRTQSASLLTAITEFFRMWCKLEGAYTAQLYNTEIRYELYEGKFVRSIAIPKNRNYTNEEIGGAISSYVSMFDSLLKGYISGKYTPGQLEAKYVECLNGGVKLI